MSGSFLGHKSTAGISRPGWGHTFTNQTNGFC